MTTTYELAEQACALLNATRKNENWTMSAPAGRPVTIESEPQSVRVTLVERRDRVRVSVKLTGTLASHMPIYETRRASLRGWKTMSLALRRDVTALALKVLAYVTTTAIAGRSAAIQRREHHEAEALERQRIEGLRREAVNVAARMIYSEAPEGSVLSRRWYGDPTPNRTIFEVGNGTEGSADFHVNEATENGDTPPTVNVKLDRIPVALAIDIAKLLRGERAAVGAEAAGAAVAIY